MIAKALLAATLLGASPFLVLSHAADSEHDGKFHFQVGLAYASGVDKLGDTIEANNPAFTVDTIIPVGLTLGAYYEITHGVAAGVTVGPALLGLGDADFYVVPIQADVRWYILPEKKITPFIRGGVAYSFAGGDFIESGSPGFVVGGGIEFFRDKHVGFGLEAAYNSAEVDVKATAKGPKQSIKVNEITASIYVRF